MEAGGYTALRRRDGSDRIVHLSVTPLEAEGKRFGYVVVLHDATALVQQVIGHEAGRPLEAGWVPTHEMGVTVFARLVRALARMAEIRDPDIEGHLERMQHVVRWLVGSHEACGAWSPEEREGVALLSMLHDLGKVAIPEGILFKPAPLSPEERKLMERHTVVGEELIRRHLEIPGLESWIARAAEIARWHHERWDGTGYPDGLAGDAIPLAARIVALVDVLDALLSRRAYKEPWPWERAVAYIREQQGRQFDPAVVDTFLKVCDAVRAYYASRGLALRRPPGDGPAAAASPR